MGAFPSVFHMTGTDDKDEPVTVNALISPLNGHLKRNELAVLFVCIYMFVACWRKYKMNSLSAEGAEISFPALISEQCVYFEALCFSKMCLCNRWDFYPRSLTRETKDSPVSRRANEIFPVIE